MWLANRSRIEHFYSFLDQRRCRVRINDFTSMTVAVHAKYRTICCLRAPSMSGGKFCIFGRSDRRNPITIDRKRVDDFSYNPVFIANTILFSIARQSLYGKLLQLCRVSDGRKPSQARGLPSAYNFFSLKRCETRSSLPRNHRNSRDPLSNWSESAVTFGIFWNEPRQRYDSAAIHPTRAARFHRQDPL